MHTACQPVLYIQTGVCTYINQKYRQAIFTVTTYTHRPGYLMLLHNISSRNVHTKAESKFNSYVEYQEIIKYSMTLENNQINYIYFWPDQLIINHVIKC